MSKDENAKVNIEKFLKDFGKKSTVYTAIVEAITNSIESIILKRNQKDACEDGEINIKIIRKECLLVDDVNRENIDTIIVSDNGVGFTDENRDSFSTLYSSYKQDIGGKGLGRMFFAKYFNNVEIRSTYIDSNAELKTRHFIFGKQFKIIESETISTEKEIKTTGAEIKMSSYIGKTKDFNDDIDTFAHKILEKILNYFAVDEFECPIINIIEDDRTITLNNLIGHTNKTNIRIYKKGSIKIGLKEKESFNYIAFKIRNIRNQVSKILLTADNKVVTEEKLDYYIPEFTEDFVETCDGTNQKYIIRYYVYGNYLNKNVNNERNEFYFEDEQNLIYPIGRREIERKIAEEAKLLMADDIKTRFEKKKNDFKKFADENIWYKPYLDGIDYEKIKINPTKEEIEFELHKNKYRIDKKRRDETKELIDNIDSLTPELLSQINEIAEKLAESDKSNLSQYIVQRKIIIDLFEKSMRWNEQEKYATERALHNIIFPTKHDSKDTPYENHNLWLINETLNFTEYLSSDKAIFKNSKDRPDIAAFHYPIAYRERNEASSPVTIFEFKRQGRTDFVDSKTEDPIDQIIRYVQQLKREGCKDINGIEINVNDATPFYGYIIAGDDKKIKEWLKDVKNMKSMPDGEGWYYYHDSLNLYIEYLTWSKVLKDAKNRNAVFFKKLNI